jgi:hypothetical protein
MPVQEHLRHRFALRRSPGNGRDAFGEFQSLRDVGRRLPYLRRELLDAVSRFEIQQGTKALRLLKRMHIPALLKNSAWALSRFANDLKLALQSAVGLERAMPRRTFRPNL